MHEFYEMILVKKKTYNRGIFLISVGKMIAQFDEKGRLHIPKKLRSKLGKEVYYRNTRWAPIDPHPRRSDKRIGIIGRETPQYGYKGLKKGY